MSTPLTIPTLSTLVWRSLASFQALHFALASGIAAATAVMVGALVVGDSMRGSLQSQVSQRLGNIDFSLVAQRFFDPTLLRDSDDNFAANSEQNKFRLIPLIVLPSVAVELNRDGKLQRAGQAQALGVDADFWQNASPEPTLHDVVLAADEVALSAGLATELGAHVGDEITLRLPKGSGVPADSPLGRRDDAAASLPRQRVAIILPAKNVGDIDFRAGQQVTRNVFVPLAGLADVLAQPGKVNAAVAVSSSRQRPKSLAIAQRCCDQINARIMPTLGDYGLKLTRHTRTFPDETIGEESETEPAKIFDYYQITSEQLIIDDITQRALFKPLEPLGAQRALSYLVNQISVVDNAGQEQSLKVTYSIAMGLEKWELTAPDIAGRSILYDQRPTMCWVNSWLAERLELHPGSVLRLTFFKPETTDGREVEVTQDVIVSDIAPVTAPAQGYVRNRAARFAQAPSVFNDPSMTPVVPGITDQDSISKWDLPFKLTREIPKQDDDYWQDYRLTPKIFLRYAAAARYFGSRFGSATAIRINADNVEESELLKRATEAMLHAKAAFGLQFQPILQLQLQAASGTTPFDGLFLALSFFVIVSALLLVALLFRLSIEQRAKEWGLLLAAGFPHTRVRRLLLYESAIVVVGGVMLGIALGLGYARLMIAGLETWWVGAISAGFLRFSFTLQSLLIGAGLGGLMSLLTILACLWRLNRKQPLDLLRGRWTETRASDEPQSKVALALAGFMFFGSCGFLALATTQTGMAQAGCFFGCGMLLLSASITAAMHMLRRQRPTQPTNALVRPGLWSMSWQALTRNPWRSILTLGLLAVASFLIASMSIFQIAPDLGGSGGFELMAESSLPLYRDPGSIRVREEVLGKEDYDTLRNANIISFRAKLGEDASCNNLYQVAQPTVLGVPDSLAQYEESILAASQFQWAAAEDKQDGPWHALSLYASGVADDPIPVIMDLNTAAWSLHQGASLGAITKIQFDDRVIHFRTIGLLSNSLLQGKLLISQKNFGSIFPEQNGFRFFLIHAEGKPIDKVTSALENGWSDEGLDATSTQAVLTKLLAVQNTYISAFQAIGALGLLLGTIGLAVVQIRSVLERRRELALLQAIGYSRSRIAQMLLCESLLLLVSGLLIGVFAASIAIIPFMLGSGSQANLLEPLMLLVIVLVVGIVACSLAVVTALRQPLLPNLT